MAQNNTNIIDDEIERLKKITPADGAIKYAESQCRLTMPLR